MVLKIKTGVLVVLGTCFQEGFDYCPYREIFVYIFFFCLINNLCLISLSDQGNETKSTEKLSDFNFQWTKPCTAILALSEHLSLIN